MEWSPGSDDGRPKQIKERLKRVVNMSIKGRFTKVAETNNSIVVGTIGALKEATYDEVLEIARFYNINTEPDKFKYHCITSNGAEKRGCKLPVNNYNEFIEIFK